MRNKFVQPLLIKINNKSPNYKATSDQMWLRQVYLNFSADLTGEFWALKYTQHKVDMVEKHWLRQVARLTGLLYLTKFAPGLFPGCVDEFTTGSFEQSRNMF